MGMNLPLKRENSDSTFGFTWKQKKFKAAVLFAEERGVDCGGHDCFETLKDSDWPRCCTTFFC
jgi:hypothetical protein